MSIMETRLALIEARLSRLENPGLPIIPRPTPASTAPSIVVRQPPSISIAPRASSSIAESYIVFVFESDPDVSIIHQAAGHNDFPKFEIITHDTLSLHQKRYIQEHAFVCRVRFLGGRMADDTIPDILYYAQTFGNDRTLLLMMWNNAPALRIEKFTQDLQQGVVFTDKTGRTRSRLVHWQYKSLLKGPVNKQLLDVDASIKRLMQVIQVISQ